MHSWSTFGVRTSHGQLEHTRLAIVRTWGKPPPSPLLYIMRLLMGATSKWLFVPGLSSGSLEIATTWTPATLRTHNFLCTLPIVMRYKAKLYPSSRSFQRYFARCLHAREMGRFLTFSGRESNYHFDSRPFYCT
jgi:hypothetical protein